MPVKKSNPSKKSPKKRQRSAKENAALKSGAMTAQRESAKSRGPGISEKQRSQGRFPGETPLTGEDRPADKAGGKKRIRAGDRAGK